MVKKHAKPKKQVQGCTTPDLNLHKYQLSVANWLYMHPKQKGLIVNFETGTGKTFTAANVAEVLLNSGMGINKVVIVTPKSTSVDFRTTVQRCTANNSNKYEYYTYDMFSVKDVDDATLLIIDEAHNTRNSSTERSKKLRAAAAIAKKVLVLTATLFFNNVNDISIPAHMVLPEKEHKYFPTDKQAFVDMYNNNWDVYVKRMKNYIAMNEDIAHLKPLVNEYMVEVPLSDTQFSVINGIRDKAVRDNPQFQTALSQALSSGVMAGNGLKGINAFLTKVRQISNSIMPVSESGMTMKISRVEADGKIVTEKKQTKATFEACPKIGHMAAKIFEIYKNNWSDDRDKRKPQLVYSEYLEYGLFPMKKALRMLRIPENEIAVFHGSLTQNKRNEIIKAYNSGSVAVLLYTAAGSEGISLFKTRAVHIMEPYWNMARINQAKARAIRMNSHSMLPENERLVDIYIYMSSVPVKRQSEVRKQFEIAPDPYLWTIALKKEQIINQMKELNKQASIPTSFEAELEYVKDHPDANGLLRIGDSEEKVDAKDFPPEDPAVLNWVAASLQEVHKEPPADIKAFLERPKTKKGKSKCFGHRPPCPADCTRVKISTYVRNKGTKKEKQITRNTHCRKKSTKRQSKKQ